MTQRRTSPVASVALLLCGISTAAALAPYPLGLHAAASLLEVTLPTPKATVKAAYRRKARISHPDVSKRADAASHFVQLTAAYETLLQFSVTMPATAPPRANTRTETTTTTTSASPPPRPPSSQWPGRHRSRAEPPARSSAVRAAGVGVARLLAGEPAGDAAADRSRPQERSGGSARRRAAAIERPAQRVAQGGRRCRRGRVPRAVRTGEREALRRGLRSAHTRSARRHAPHPGGRASGPRAGWRRWRQSRRRPFSFE